MRWPNSLSVLTLAVLAASATAGAQTGRITGIVTDNQTGQPLANATIIIRSDRYLYCIGKR